MNYSIRDIDAALLDAAKRGDLNEAKSLISKRADVNATNTNYDNSLYLAVENDHLDIAKVLLDNGADFITFDAAQVRHVYDKFLKIQDEYCKSSLHLAARLGDLKAVEDLLKKEANVNAKNDKGQTPLHLTVEVCYVDIPNPDEVDDYWNQSFAAEKKCGYVKIVEALLRNEEINVNAQDNNKKTSLHYAAKNNNKEIVVALIEAEADVNIRDENRETPLHLAARNNNKEIVVALIKAGADVSITGKNEEIPLDLAIDEEIKVPLINATLLKAVQEGDVQKVRHLISKKADVNISDETGKTLSYYAIQKENFEMVIALIKARVNVNAVDKDGRTPLHWAVHKENLEIVNVLIQVRADVNAQDLYERTPLHYATMSGDIKVVEALLKIKEIDINLADKDGNTPFDLAKTEEIKALLKKAAEKTDDSSVSTDSEGDQEEDTEPEDNVQPSLQEQKEESQEFIAEEVSDVQIEDADNGHSIDIALTKNGVNPRSESSTSEEYPSSFFDNLLNIIMKPFSLIASFFGVFFSWLFGPDEPSTESDQIIAPSNSGGEGLKNYQEGDNNII
ncbi:MAG: ankyrin repeat domain-containing protein [Wolbachia pipientis]